MTFAITLGHRLPQLFRAAVPAYEQRRPPRGLATGARPIDRHVSANFYPTPPEATRALLSVETFNGTIWEPACGKGHIAKVLEAHHLQVIATDLNDWSYGTAGVDFLNPHHIAATRRTAPSITHIVTNPPYGSGLADDFVEQALKVTAETSGKVAMLLNLSSLVAEQRSTFWRTRPPARIYGIDGVVCWPDPARKPPRHFLQHRYFWAVWEHGHEGPATFWWLSAAEFRTPAPQHNKKGN